LGAAGGEPGFEIGILVVVVQQPGRRLERRRLVTEGVATFESSRGE